MNCVSVFDFLRLAWVKKLPRGDSSWLNNWLNLQPIGANGKRRENKVWVFDLVQDVCEQGLIRQWGNLMPDEGLGLLGSLKRKFTTTC